MCIQNGLPSNSFTSTSSGLALWLISNRWLFLQFTLSVSPTTQRSRGQKHDDDDDGDDDDDDDDDDGHPTGNEEII